MTAELVTSFDVPTTQSQYDVIPAEDQLCDEVVANGLAYSGISRGL